MTIIYALSGIALNHLNDWNPSYEVARKRVQWGQPFTGTPVPKDVVLAFLETYGETDNYKKHYHPEPTRLKIFLKSENVEVDLPRGQSIIETLKRRPVLYEVNFLHYNPRRLWTWLSDVFCASLCSWR
jgi:hypothetical protein